MKLAKSCQFFLYSPKSQKRMKPQEKQQGGGPSIYLSIYLYKKAWTWMNSITLEIHKENRPYLSVFRLMRICTSELFYICLMEQFLWRKTGCYYGGVSWYKHWWYNMLSFVPLSQNYFNWAVQFSICFLVTVTYASCCFLMTMVKTDILPQSFAGSFLWSPPSSASPLGPCMCCLVPIKQMPFEWCIHHSLSTMYSLMAHILSRMYLLAVMQKQKTVHT